MENILSFISGHISPKRAIAYYRHSAEDKQENSVPIQREHARKFATEHGIEIIHEEADEGKTGLLADRPGFTNLFQEWILNAASPSFQYVLVHDVSRWGRFQDQDEAAYYEFRCKQQGKKVIYISRGFPKEEEQLITHLQTSIERYMAAEYSRQLSHKVFHGCVKVSEQGYSAGGMPCYGMGRLLLDAQKKPIRILQKGEHKQIANERVTFVPLNDHTTKAVYDIFAMFVQENLSLSEIERILNERGVLPACGGLWNRDKLVRILMNETYTGARIYNKTWNRLKQGKRDNPRSEWVVCRDAFPPIVDRAIFDKAQEKLWFTLGKWKEGRRAMKEAKMRILKGISSFLTTRGISEDDLFFISRDFPFIFSVSAQISPTVKEWCFVLPEEMRSHEYVFGIGVILGLQTPVDQFFKIPSKDFGVAGISLLADTETAYKQYHMTAGQLEENILKIVDRYRGR